MPIDPLKFEAILRDIYDGLSLTRSLEKHGVVRSTFYKFISHNLKSADDYACARQAQADLYVEEILPIADNESIDPNRARNMIQARQWTASKIRPSVYGDKLDVTVTATASITDALEAAAARTLALSRPEKFIQSEVTDISAIDTDRSTGSKPVAQSELNESVDPFAELLK